CCWSCNSSRGRRGWPRTRCRQRKPYFSIKKRARTSSRRSRLPPPRDSVSAGRPKQRPFHAAEVENRTGTQCLRSPRLPEGRTLASSSMDLSLLRLVTGDSGLITA
ncbi:unnamed protein product, partial [Ixodes pacificus]